MIKILLIVSLVIGIVFFPRLVLAETDFSTSYEVKYEVMLDGFTQVTQTITLKNLTSKYYASNFTLTTGSTTVSNLTAYNEKGPLEAKISNQDNRTNVTVNFPETVVGQDKSQTFTLRYKSKDFAEQIGKVWEVNLPKAPGAVNIENYNLVLSVPVSFGEPTSISPKPISETQSGDRLLLNFQKNQLERSGVSVNFGTSQTYDFNLNYNLENTTLTPNLTYVTLPPDTEYQDVLIRSITPRPENVTTDQDGNYLAWYRLDRKSQLPVNVQGTARLYIESKIKKPIPLAPELQKKLTQSDTHWEKDNPLIKNALDQIFKDGKGANTSEKVEKIYRYVVDSLKYDVQRINSPEPERLGAVTTLNNSNSALCMEFTDLFIALARAEGIPTRELDGFAYSQNSQLRPLSLSKDLLHAWPEYYDENRGWVMVDPTWENTSGGVDYFHKFDLDHFVLAIKGHSSQAPFTTDDVKVNVSTTPFNPERKVDVEVSLPNQFWSGFSTKLQIKIINTGQVISRPADFTVKTTQAQIMGPNQATTVSVPPWGFVNYQFNIKTPSLWQTYHDTVTVEIDGQKFTKDIEIQPFFLFGSFPYLLVGLVGLILITYFVVLTVHVTNRSLRTKHKAAKT